MSLRAAHDALQKILLTGLNAVQSHVSDEGAIPFVAIDCDAEGIGGIEAPGTGADDAESLADAFRTSLERHSGGEAGAAIADAVERHGVQFQAGTLAGLVEGAIRDLTNQVKFATDIVRWVWREGSEFITEGAQTLADRARYVPPAFLAVFRAWVAPRDSEEFRREGTHVLAAIPPEVREAIEMLGPADAIVREVRQIVEELLSDERLRRRVLLLAASSAGELLGPIAAEIVRHRHDPVKLGRIFGAAVGEMVGIAAVTRVFGIARIPLKAISDPAELSTHAWGERVRKAAHLIAMLRKEIAVDVRKAKAAGKLTKQMTKRLRKHAFELMRFSRVVLPHRQIRHLGKRFNILMVLLHDENGKMLNWWTSHHLFEGTFYDRWPEVFRQRLGWLSRADMPAMLVFTDGHYGHPPARRVFAGELTDAPRPAQTVLREPGESDDEFAKKIADRIEETGSFNDLETFLRAEEKVRPFRTPIEAIDAHERWYRQRLTIPGKDGAPIAEYQRVLSPILEELERIRQRLR